jgi:drug/metabolite transporter (DMT)-like permease
MDPIMLAGVLYLSSGTGLTTWWLLRRRSRGSKGKEAGLRLADLPWLVGAILAGGVVGPILLMMGLRFTPASSASLLLNLEGVLTAVFAWFVFKENFDRRIALGMATITAGGLVLSYAGRPESGVPWGALAIAAACLAWAVDNNLTRKISASDPVPIAAAKGFVAGVVNLSAALFLGAGRPGTLTLITAAAVGFIGYGVSLTLFVRALRHIGTARTGAYFSLAPFVGAAVSIILLRDGFTVNFLAAAILIFIVIVTPSWLYVIRQEEKFLLSTLGNDYRMYLGRTRRLIPFVY